MRAALASVPTDAPDITRVAAAANASDGLRRSRRLGLTLVVVDYYLPVRMGFSLVAERGASLGGAPAMLTLAARLEPRDARRWAILRRLRPR